VSTNKSFEGKSAKHLIALFLLPTYFISHNYLLYKEQVDFSSISVFLVLWLILPLIIYGSLLWLFKEKKTTAVVLAILFLLFFFSFGPVYSFLKAIVFLRWLTKVSVILFLVTIISVLIVVFANKINLEKNKLPDFILILFSIFILFDLVNFFCYDNELTRNKYDLEEAYPMSSIKAPMKFKPDIYYIVFDELMQTKAVAELLNYDNSALDAALVNKGFFVAKNSKSAYFATPFSIASAFQGSVFKNEKKNNIHVIEYLIAYNEVQQNAFIPYFINNGYEIKNYAHYKIFEEEKRDKIKYPLINTSQIVTNQTFAHLAYHLTKSTLSDKFGKYFDVPIDDNIYLNDQKMLINKISQIKSEAGIKSESPKFVHGYFSAPHLPVFFDSTGKPLSSKEIKYYNKFSMFPHAYKINLAYTRSLIIKLVEDIKAATADSAIIIIQSDHGYRGNKSIPVPTEHKFNNFTALYFPDRDYRLVSDDFYLPNTFRLLINKLTINNVPYTPFEFKSMNTNFLDD
jgi:hypothetical protein